MQLVIPDEFARNDSVPEGDEVGEDVSVECIARRKGAGDMSAGALVGEDP